MHTKRMNHSGSNGSQMCIVTGPNIDIAIKLIKTFEGIFSNTKLGLTFNDKETVLRIKWLQYRGISF